MTSDNSSPLYKIISDEAMMAILTLGADGRCLYANRMAHDLLEFPFRFDLANFKVEALFSAGSPTDRRVRRFSKETLETEGLIQEIVIQKWNGVSFMGTLGVKHILVDGESGHLLMIQDVTVQKKLQRELTEKQTAIHQAYQDLLQQNQKLKELDLAKNRFIALTTHELRTPLSAMVASAEILKLKLFDTPAQQEEFTAMIYDQGQQLLTLVNDILDFAKIQSNKMDYYIEEKDLGHVVQKEVDGLQSMAAEAKVTMVYDRPTHPVLCFFDEVRILQVLANLINNAIKYNNTGGEVRVSIEETDEWVRVLVKDTGPGIPEEHQAKVFNEFETLGKLAHHSKGTGLGLPITQRMIRAMGGDVKLASEVGKGSTFWVEVPKKAILAPENYRARPDDGNGDLAA